MDESDRIREQKERETLNVTETKRDYSVARWHICMPDFSSSGIFESVLPSIEFFELAYRNFLGISWHICLR